MLNGRVISGFGLTTLSRNHPHTVVVETGSLEKIASEMSIVLSVSALLFPRRKGTSALSYSGTGHAHSSHGGCDPECSPSDGLRDRPTDPALISKMLTAATALHQICRACFLCHLG